MPLPKKGSDARTALYDAAWEWIEFGLEIPEMWSAVDTILDRLRDKGFAIMPLTKRKAACRCQKEERVHPGLD